MNTREKKSLNRQKHWESMSVQCRVEVLGYYEHDVTPE